MTIATGPKVGASTPLLAAKKIVIYADGACKGNPGPGGWGAIIEFGDRENNEIYGGEPGTTNNRMELTAAIKALESLTYWRYMDCSDA